MTTPAPADPSLDAPSLIGTGIDAMAQTSGRLGITWGLKLATVINSNSTLSDNVSVTVDGESSQVITIPLIKRRPVYGPIETVRTMQPGDRVYVLNTPSGLFAMSTSPDQEVTTVDDLVLFDNFPVDQSSGWGPDWTSGTGNVSVSLGGAIIGPGASSISYVGVVPARASVYLLNVRPASLGAEGGATPYGVLTLTLSNMDIDIVMTNNHDDLTVRRPRLRVDSTGDTGNGLGSDVPVLGTTSAADAFDLYMTIASGRVNIWSAPSFYGINITAPVTFPAVTSGTAAGSLTISYAGSGPIPWVIGTIVIRSI